MKVKVKICGVKTLEAAQASINAGADFLGFNFVPTSKRLMSNGIAKQIIDELPKTIAKVGVFMDADILEIHKLINYLKLDYVQLHGNESPKYVSSVQGAGIIKTISLPIEFDVEKTKQKMKKYQVDYFLLDREEQGRGKMLDLDMVKELTSAFPIILAGGLTVENVSQTVKLAHPQVVDVAGGVEANGAKDKERITEFIKNAKLYDI
ncbi:phosphoribosylanthranilate isomerase [Candidatus Gottesmanbacteria bacterium]|nr:phosphoribosylanthranilate isomerase [Candidatus Gottesmanbacteria bacterium]